MEYKTGDRVKHPSMAEWGVGEILGIRDGKATVFFVGTGEKSLSLSHVKLIHVQGEEAAHPLLDNLRVPTSGRVKFLSLKEAIESFISEYPGGFYGEVFSKAERDYKVKAHDLATGLLSKSEMNALLAAKNNDEICLRATRVMNATNLVFKNEKMSFKDGILNSEESRLFAETLFNILHGDGDIEIRFAAFAESLGSCGAAKWPIVSYFQFIFFPEQYGFVKPQTVKHAAELSAFEINYRSDLNWKTYKSIQDFYRYLKEQLTELNPRDMIDVQSFMWCIGDRD